MAKNPDTVKEFLGGLAVKVKQLWEEEQKVMMKMKEEEAKELGFEYSGKLDFWDFRHYFFSNSCTDLKFNIIIFRTGEIEEEAIAHEGNKAARAIFLKNGLVFTTGFTKHSERQYSLRAPGHLDDPIVMVELDTSNGVMFPLYDPDANLIYLCGKVGCSILLHLYRQKLEGMMNFY